MEPGQLRHRITLQSPVVVRDDLGQPVETTWTDEAERWAKVEPLSGRELEQARAIEALASHRITVRARGLEALTASWRAVFEGRSFHIAYHLRSNEVPDFLQLYCSEVQ